MISEELLSEIPSGARDTYRYEALNDSNEDRQIGGGPCSIVLICISRFETPEGWFVAVE